MRVRRRFYSRQAIAFAIAMIGTGASALADTASWLNPVSGNWTDATKWSTNPIYPNNRTPTPDTHYSVIIDAAGAPYTVVLDSGIAPNGLTLNSSDAVLNQVAGNMAVNGAINL
jgi:hypothetical protein